METVIPEILITFLKLTRMERDFFGRALQVLHREDYRLVANRFLMYDGYFTGIGLPTNVRPINIKPAGHR
jgi:hypothetical protein